MALRDMESFRKPLDEPFRDWDFDHCEYCHSKMSLFSNKCSHCGYSRNYHDQKMIKTLLAWRDSDQGKKAWEEETKRSEELKAWFAGLDRRNDIILGSTLGFVSGFFIIGLLGLMFLGSFLMPGLIGGVILGFAMSDKLIR